MTASTVQHRTGRQPRSAHRVRPLVATLAAVSVLATVLATALSGVGVTPAQADPAARHPVPRLRPTQFHGVNWADPRDNYVNGPVIPSGLSIDESYASTYATSRQIIRGFAKTLGANTVRLPVNPYSVGTAWWSSYRAAIDAARHQGFRVIVSYWEGSDAAKDGRVDDPDAWWAMWDTLTRTYRHDPKVYFEPMNEPFGYSETEWESLATDWVHRYTARGIPRDRIFVSGTSYNDHVSTVCSVPALRGTYVSQHYYGFWGNHDYAGWIADFTPRLGDQNCSDRTVLDEFGVPMTTGIDYTGSSTTGDPDTDNSVAFLQAVTDTVRARRMGAVYWPGLRTGDTYSLETLSRHGRHLQLTVTNRSGLQLLEYAWGRSAS